jgi:histidine triad (HIT) family protein
VPPDGCVFCRVVAGELPADVAHRAEGFIAIHDIAPKASVHVLVVPERHLDSLRDVASLSPDEAKRLLDFVAETARVLGVDDYRVIVNVGPGGGQSVFHLHWHILAGDLPAFA